MKHLLAPMAILISIAVLQGCAVTKTVRKQDMDAWDGQPVMTLQKHPFFVTVPVVKTRIEDGTEIWNFVNGRDVSSCFGQGAGFASGYTSSARYSSFMSCTSGRIVCNNVFYIKNDRVEKYTPVGRCYTDETVRPDWKGPTGS